MKAQLRILGFVTALLALLIGSAYAAPGGGGPGGGGGGGGGGGCFIATAGFGSHLDRSADFIRERESANARKISLGLVLLATLCFVTFRRRCRS